MNRKTLETLRLCLQEMTEHLPVGEHPAGIEALRADTDHTITIVESEHPIERYTCGVYSFHLVENSTYLSVATTGLGGTFAGAEFIQFVLRSHLLVELEPEAATIGDLVMYFNRTEFKHVGRVAQDQRIQSKWGMGFLYNHEVWEVPAGYGDVVRYFMGTDPDASFELFITYAESKGFAFEPPPGV